MSDTNIPTSSPPPAPTGQQAAPSADPTPSPPSAPRPTQDWSKSFGRRDLMVFLACLGGLAVISLLLAIGSCTQTGAGTATTAPEPYTILQKDVDRAFDQKDNADPR